MAQRDEPRRTHRAGPGDRLISNFLATGIGHPVVPCGEEEIRFQLSADHTAADVDEVLAVLACRPKRGRRDFM
jgi:7-keto-8-aminopelargonate synthetase-like enzyme